ncbi:2-oxoglutarate dehydrogenase-like, mitochondrial [Glossina fuscipes fuscipes]
MKNRQSYHVLRFTFLDGKYMDCSFKLPATTYIGGKEQELTLREILKRLEKIYCGTMGIEYMYIYSDGKRDWIRQRLEKPGCMEISKEKKLLIFKRLLRATRFEAFLARKWAAEKRFGLEGCDVMIPCLKEIIDVSSNLGVESFVIGLAHRGRLNTLANVCRKPLDQILAQFHSLDAQDLGSGDVKYHLGTFTERLNRVTNKNVRLCLVANPSHLESVNPVAQGKARSEQFYRGDLEGRKAMCILIHGDASFSGQGIVYESMHLSDLPSYTVHGIVHIVINNQIGFTTDPRFSRSSPNCTDVARVVNAPIFHVNADDPEASVHLSKICAEWRAAWRQDVVLDLVGYRRNGHNEADEPMFTQPLMYTKIRAHKPVFDLYCEKLLDEKVITKELLKQSIDEYDAILEQGFEDAKKITTIKYSDWLDSPWTGFFQSRDNSKVPCTGVDEKILCHIGYKFSSPPPPEQNFILHKGIERILAARKQLVDDRTADWALGEALAMGSLLREGVHVRLSGEDVERGTFSHRHHVLHHQTLDKVTYCAMKCLYPDQAIYSVCNSSLSEMGILGFEHGYSMTNPNALVIWESQFGDFYNTAQSIVDAFISSGEMKWVRQSGLVIMMPHGLEGQGPEHSSGRVERFLQMSDDDPDTLPEVDCDDDNVPLRQLRTINWIVANCTTPANWFHIMRRQVALPFRKPLVLLTPKTGLRHPLARSNFCDMIEGTEFQRIIPDYGPASQSPDDVCKLVFCSGKVYFDLFKARAERRQECKVALVRVEQICPFPYDLVREQILFYRESELIWAQEEHKNQGAWYYVHPRFKTAMTPDYDEGFIINYVGRPCAAAPATGNKNQFDRELHNLITDIFGELTEEDREFIKATEEAARAKAQEAAKSDAAKAKAQEAAKAVTAKAKTQEAGKANAAEAKAEEAVKADVAKENPEDVSKADAAKIKPQEASPKPPNEGIPPSAPPVGSPPMKTPTPPGISTPPGGGKSNDGTVLKPDPSAPNGIPPKTDDSSPSKPDPSAPNSTLPKTDDSSPSKPDPSAPNSTPPKTDDSSPSKPGTHPVKK